MQDLTGSQERVFENAVSVVIPIFNDWESLARLLKEIDAAWAL
jgi:hypothetical protein